MLEFGERKIRQLRERRLLLFLLTRASRMASKAKGIPSLSEQGVTAFAHVIVVFSAHRIPTFTPYPNSIKRVFREKIGRAGKRGRCSLEVWPGLHIGTVIKHTVNKHLKEVIRKMSHGNLEKATELLKISNGGTMLNTSCI